MNFKGKDSLVLSVGQASCRIPKTHEGTIMESGENGHGVNTREAIERTAVLSTSGDLTKISC